MKGRDEKLTSYKFHGRTALINKLPGGTEKVKVPLDLASLVGTTSLYYSQIRRGFIILSMQTTDAN